jgi:uncharacterized membrane protein YebE (DUF533 family)
MNMSDILGMMVQSGMTKSASNRMGNALGTTGQQGGGGLSELLGSLTGGGGSQGGIADMLSGFLSGSKSGGGAGGMLQDVLGDAGRAVGGNNKLAMGGLGALVGALLGGKGDAVKGAVGGGLMAMLGAMAFKALKASGESPEVPIGLKEPEDKEESEQLERHSGLVLTAMLSAAKSDGKLDRNEIERILGHAKESEMGAEVEAFLMDEMRKPIDLEGLCAKARGNRELAAEIYAASLLAIEVDTPNEQAYMTQLAKGLNLPSQTTQQIEAMMGVRA